MGIFMFKELAALFRFLLKTPKEEKKIIFYSEHGGYWPYLGSFAEELVDKHKQPLCYVTSDPNHPILQTTKPLIKSFYLNKLLPLFMILIKSKVFVLTLTDLNQFHLKRSINSVHYVYVFHSLVSTHMVYRYGAFDYYDSILCFGQHQIEEIRKHEEINKLPAKKLIEVGYPRVERIYAAYNKYLLERKEPLKKTILVAPSWGAANILESCGEQLTEILLEANYEVIVRPHPETIKHFPELMTLFVSKFGSNPNFKLELSVATDDSLLQADVLITDYSGILFEYSFGTERPVLSLDVPPKVNNLQFKELNIEPLELSLRSKLGVVVSPEDLKNVPEEIIKLIERKEYYKKHIQELRKQHIFSFGHSSEIGAQYIFDLLKN
jgi:hypothetical protein